MGAIAPGAKWCPADDLLLKNAVEAGATLESLSKGAVRFSQRYTVQELQYRWHSLLYDPIVSVESSALMFDYECSSLKTLAKSSKSDGTKDTKSLLRKRKAESIRSRYYTMRKMRFNVSQAVDPLDMNFIAGPGLTNYGNQNEASFADYVLPDSFHLRCPDSTFEATTQACPDGTSAPNIFVSHGLSLDPGDPGHNTLLPLEGNTFSTRDHFTTENYGQLHAMEGISAPILPDVNYGGKEGYINDTFRSANDVDCPETLQSSGMHPNTNLIEQMPSIGPETETAGILAQLNQFMDCPDPDDLPDTIDEFYIDAFSTLLAEHPNKHEGAIACPSVTSVATEEYPDLASGAVLGEPSDKNSNHCSIGQGIFCNPQEKEKLLSSALSVNPDFPELRYGVICCKLNTADPVIPDNDDVFLPVCMPTPPLSCSADWEFDKARNPISSSIMDIPTHQRASRGGLLVMKNEQSDNDNTRLSSQRSRSLFPTLQKYRNEGSVKMKREQIDNERAHIFSPAIGSLFQNQDNTTHGQGLMLEREQIDTKDQITSSSIPNPQKTSDQAMPMMKIEETDDNQTRGSSHIMSSSLPPVMSLNHAVSVHADNHKLKHIDLGGDMLRNVNVNNQISQLKCTNENENNSRGLYINKKVICMNQTGHQNDCPEGSLKSQIISHNQILGSSNIVGASKTKNENASEFYNEVFSHEELDASEQVAPELEKDSEFLSSGGCNDDDDVPYFSDVEAMILDMDLSPNDEDSDHIETASRHPNEKFIRTMLRLEQAARASSHRMMQLYGAFAVLYGHHSRHLIKKPEVLLGRTAEDIQVDIDLSVERCKNKVSRRQAIIKVNNDGAFSLKNLGKVSIYVNGREVAPKESQYLTSSCLIEIRNAALLFEINPVRVKQYVEEEIQRRRMIPKQEPSALE